MAKTNRSHYSELLWLAYVYEQLPELLGPASGDVINQLRRDFLRANHAAPANYGFEDMESGD